MTSRADADPAFVADASLERRFAAAGLDWIVPAWPAPDGVQAFFTTRNGGRMENLRRAEAFLPSQPIWLEQVHGADVVVLGDLAGNTPCQPLRRGDAAVTRAPGVVLAARVADCLPVLLSDRAGSVIGVAHAGWRGLAAGVLENTVAAMACDPADIVAWLGPAIGTAAFEVGPDVRDAFVRKDAGAGNAFVPGAPGKWHANLDALARRRLARAGVGRAAGGGMCTASDPARFFSFRREHTSARMGAFIWRSGR